MALDDSPPLYLQIATQMAELIRNGSLGRGSRMPSVRALARQRGVAQSTVVQAYHWLEDARLVTARPRTGYFVAARPVALPEPSVSRGLRRPAPPPATGARVGARGVVDAGQRPGWRLVGPGG